MLWQVHSSVRVLSAKEHLIEDGAMPDVYLSLPSLFPNSTEEKNNGGSLMETSRSEENHGDILVTVFRDTS